MKTLITTLIVALGLISPALAEPVQIRFDIKYQGVDSKWLSDLSANAKKALKPKGGSFSLPGVTARGGETATIEVIQEYRTGTKPSGPAVPCGVIVNCSPEVTDGGIRISGKAVLRRATQKTARGRATQFEAQEVLIDLDVDNGVSTSIDLVDGGQIQVVATLIDATGRPIKK